MGGWLCQAAQPFYKHPIEILADSVLVAVVLDLLLGCLLEGAALAQLFRDSGRTLLSFKY